MKRLAIACVIVLSSIVGYSEETVSENDWTSLKERMKALRSELARQGAYAFVTNRETTPAVAPYVHSQCWVDWLPRENVERIAYEQEKREFGLDFVLELEKLALVEIPLDDVVTLRAHADHALKIAEWWKTSGGGYGNFILKKWSEGIALTLMGKLAVSDKSDTNDIIRLLRRIDGLKVNLAWRVGILNEESPHKYRIPAAETSSAATQDLEDQWGVHLREAMLWCKKRTGYYDGLSFEEAKNENHEYAFYLRSRGKHDIVRHWWNKQHHGLVCIYGMSEVLSEDISEILRIRSVLGKIPTPSEEEIHDLNKGFNYKLRLESKCQAKIGAWEERFHGASAVYRVYEGTFADWTTRYLQLYVESNPR